MNPVSRTARPHAATVLAACAMMLGAAPALALDEAANEKDLLKSCERRLCEIVARKPTSGPDLACSLSKTWNKTTIKEGVEKKKLSWVFGDARCSIDVTARREAIVDAVSKPEQVFEFRPHTIKCQIEREQEVTTVNVTIAPKITFKDGKAQKAWINLKEIEAPAVIRGAIWTAAQAENYLGLFHGDMISEINELVGQKCPKVVAGN